MPSASAVWCTRLIELPALVERTLALDPVIHRLAERFADKHHALFLGRGALYPIAMEGALKLKEISYIHAEAYPAGELKHGPLALVDADMPVITVAPNNELLEKLKSNLHGSARARRRADRVRRPGGAASKASDGVTVIEMPRARRRYFQAPVVYTDSAAAARLPRRRSSRAPTSISRAISPRASRSSRCVELLGRAVRQN